ncbi:MAG: hypothetical protein HY924_01985 [Elusimicrobia bacterium]|nr:hypothetical protein [Elusimicrobiota bacterium]
MNRIVLAALALGLSVTAWAKPEPELSVGRAMSFLSSLLDKEVGLLKQDPRSKDYWLCPDNLLAVQALKATEAGRLVAGGLKKRQHAKAGKFKALFGHRQAKSAFFETELVTVARLGDKRVRTEKESSKEVQRWNEQADLLFLAAVMEKDRAMGKARLHRALKMWDGTGFLDKNVFHRQYYSAETLALALLAAGRLGVDLPMRSKILAQLARQQDGSGGFAPDFGKDSKPAGLASAKTTSLVLLGLAASP